MYTAIGIYMIYIINYYNNYISSDAKWPCRLYISLMQTCNPILKKGGSMFIKPRKHMEQDMSLSAL